MRSKISDDAMGIIVNKFCAPPTPARMAD
jgi:hypothetical protein